jgi:exodeoxyribonuclease V alpha subunit
MSGAAGDIVLDPSQTRAVDLVCEAPLGIVTGGPGTGKSTCLKYALDRLDRDRKRYELAAPTGKAARRVQETTGRPARTIHRLLEYSPRMGWQRNEHNPIDADVVIIDESSMIDIELNDALTAAIDPARTRLILIGDADQLPPVGPGRPFGDLVDSELVPTVRLQTLHRAALESWVCANAPRVLAGEMPDLTPRKDFLYVEVEDSSDVMRHVRHMVVDHIPTYVGMESQTLIPQRPGVAGVVAANRMLQDALNPRREHEQFIQRGDAEHRVELRVGDRVIQTRNDYQLAVFNGEVGEIGAIAGGKVDVHLAGRDVVTYTLEQATALHLAYALTVHRAQGSEFPWVVCVVHSTHSYILTRQLVYTAITRAKKGVVLIGDRPGLRRALSDAKPPKRNTAMIERIRGEL